MFSKLKLFVSDVTLIFVRLGPGVVRQTDPRWQPYYPPPDLASCHIVPTAPAAAAANTDGGETLPECW